ncbi:hypothetical protein ODJ79_43830 [Actinoplanes sp. KI2]|nr:hypothetical protein [Actinoplanes sp. KI2]MCU7730689.1 hypothetical protein [Actinoplanes sp. KI2]
MTMHAWTVLSLQAQETEEGPEGEGDVEGHISTISTLVNSCQIIS